MAPTKLRLVDICENVQGYIDQDIAMSNVSDTLDSWFDCRRIELRDLKPGMLSKDDWALCRLKLKTLVRLGDGLKPIIGNSRLIVLEWDTPESFMPASSLYHSYQQIAARFPNFQCFINQSKQWCERVRDLGLPCLWTLTWPPPHSCLSRPEPWLLRDRDASFAGTVHPERAQFFSELEQQGINVEVRKRVIGSPPGDYLQFIRQSRVMARTEKRDWACDGGTVPVPGYLWQRDLEVASQGTFSLREWDRAYAEWGLASVPSIVPFSDPQDCARKIKQLLALSPKDAEQLLSAGIEAVRSMVLPDGTPRHQHLAHTVDQLINPTSYMNVWDRVEFEL